MLSGTGIIPCGGPDIGMPCVGVKGSLWNLEPSGVPTVPCKVMGPDMAIFS